MQSELLPSACMVELPSKPQRGISARVGVLSKLLICVLPRSSGTGFLPSSQMYSSLYFDIGLLIRCVGILGTAPAANAPAAGWGIFFRLSSAREDRIRIG